MTNSKDNVIIFADEMLKRTGVQLDLAKVSAGNPQPERVRVDPENDFVAGLAMKLVKLVMQYADSHPVGLIAAMQVVGNTLSEEYVRKLGIVKAKELVVAATMISNQYRAEFKDGNASPKPVERDQEDDAER